MLTDSQIHESLARIAKKYRIFQCEECAEEMRHWLEGHNIQGTYIRINALGSDFIVSERVGGDTAITKNGIHCGIETHGKVYDNLPNSGLSRQAWLNDFDCIGGFEIRETAF
jgi:hypothetical protein